MQEIYTLNLYKPLGMTPLEAIGRFREQNPEYKDVPMTYAGRLDPMAEGVLLVLAGDEVHKRDEYLKLDKEYEAEILFGFETDTYDILGLPKKTVGYGISDSLKEDLDEIIQKYVGDFTFQIPPFSSYKIKGKPLFQWARDGKLDEITIPSRTVQIYDVKPLDFYSIQAKELKQLIVDRIKLVKGDFRQEEITARWREIFDLSEQNQYQVAKIRIRSSSGMYVRALADRLGKDLKLGALLLHLTRTRVGEWSIADSVQL